MFFELLDGFGRGLVKQEDVVSRLLLVCSSRRRALFPGPFGLKYFAICILD